MTAVLYFALGFTTLPTLQAYVPHVVAWVDRVHRRWARRTKERGLPLPSGAERHNIAAALNQNTLSELIRAPWAPSEDDTWEMVP